MITSESLSGKKKKETTAVQSSVPTEEDTVNNPSHYKNEKFEVIDIIEAFKLGFNLGNTIKYVLRAGKKDPSKLKEDLQKAVWYLQREINSL